MNYQRDPQGTDEQQFVPADVSAEEPISQTLTAVEVAPEEQPEVLLTAESASDDFLSHESKRAAPHHTGAYKVLARVVGTTVGALKGVGTGGMLGLALIEGIAAFGPDRPEFTALEQSRAIAQNPNVALAIGTLLVGGALTGGIIGYRWASKKLRDMFA